MPLNVTPPGVYIQEPSSGPPSIVSASTNITAFVGRTPIGPIDRPVTVFDYVDYTNLFGGLTFDYPMSYAVQDFFKNGGSEAVIVRLFEAIPEQGTGVAQLEFPDASRLRLMAKGPGEWGNRLQANVDTNGITKATAMQFAQYDLNQEDLFNITIALLDSHNNPVVSERHLNVAVKTSGKAAQFPNRLDRVLKSQSNLAVVDKAPTVPPASGAQANGAGGNNGTSLSAKTYIGELSQQTGMHLLEKTEIFNLLCIPPDRRIFPEVPERVQDLDASVRQAAGYCALRRAIYIVDPPAKWTDLAVKGQIAQITPDDLGITGKHNGIEIARNAAVYFPRVWRQDLLIESQLALFVPCGMIAGVIAATDVRLGVWKAPAGIEAAMAGVSKFEVTLTDAENAHLNPLGINCLREFPVMGPLVWGDRTLRGADQIEDDYKYLSVRRLTLFIEQSLLRGTQWAVFEPNDEALWSSLRLSVNAFLADLARQGAFYGYSVACDTTTTTQNDIDRGIVNILVQIAPVKPAEFVVFQIQQLAGQSPS